MSVAEQLHTLDSLDDDIARLEAELADMRRRMRRNPALEDSEARLEALRVRERTTTSGLREREAELAGIEARIERDQQRMYGGQIVDPRELGSIERELEHHRAQRDAGEEQVLALMETLEEIQSELAAASREANTLRERWEGDRPALALELEHTTDVLAGMREEREKLAATIEPRTRDLYGVTRARAGHAVSPLAGSVCGACRVTLPPRDIQHVRSGALVTCPNCTRILYAGR